MNKQKKLTKWHEAYREIAESLHAFQKNIVIKKKEQSVAEGLFNLLNDTAFSAKNKWFVRGIEKWNNKTLDPIQLFAAISHSKSSERSRYENIRIVLNLLGSDARIDEGTDFFSGCPTVMMSRPVVTRTAEFQTEIWEMFDSVMTDELAGLREDNFMQYKNWYGLELVSFTIFLFWIDSDNFLPLDANTRTFLVGIGKWESVPYDYEAYTDFCKSIRDKSIIRDIVKIAYQFREGKKERIVYRRVTSEFLGISSIEERDEKIRRILHPFRLIAIRPTQLGGHSKNLQAQFYHLYNDYKFVDEKDIEIHYTESDESRNLFQQGSTDVQISAIVGKNGSGKSTLSELIYLGINALSRTNSEISNELVGEEVYLDFFFYTTDLFKLSIYGKQIQVYKYDHSIKDGNEIFKLVDKDVIDEFSFKSFFYTIGINYSLYGLNVNNLNPWIDPLFYKNDSYQVPVVLNPKRTKGNIDVNTEESLSISRLMSHILDLDRFDESEDGELLVPELVENKRPKKLRISFNSDKYTAVVKKYGKYKVQNRLVEEEAEGKVIIESNVENVFDIFWKRLGNPTVKASKNRKLVENYIVYKLFAIADTYKRYRNFVRVNHRSKTIEFIGFTYFFMDEVLKDTSHVTFKLWQAINYLIYDHIPIGAKNSDSYSIKELALEINDLRALASGDDVNKERYPDRDYAAILFIPPSIFTVDIEFESGYLFSGLSSGEKQSIFTINTVAYHLFNLNSVDTSVDLQTYSRVNVLFDEVELCFHPDMQRTFIYNLLRFLRHLELPNIPFIHFQFITHSPFILSDIPDINILRLKLDEKSQLAVSDKDMVQTFGANIHSLLADSFFMGEGFIGEFAKQKIQGVLDNLNKLEGLEIKMEQNEIWNTIQLIGEPFLKIKLSEMYFKNYPNDAKLDAEISAAKAKLAILESIKNQSHHDSN